MKPLPYCRAFKLEKRPAEKRWLIEDLWSDQAVGIVGGEPKSCKSFLALDVAVSVASGVPCLRRFPVKQTGRVLLFAAEDPLHDVRFRLEGIARAVGVDFEGLPIEVLTVPVLRLDLEEHRKDLTATMEAVRPRLLVLDPFVRLHRGDENVVAEVAPLLGYLRHLQRHFQAAVLLVHHARKGATHVRGGQALRGSSELHAWGDSNLYVRRRGEELFLAMEHRAAASLPEMALELRGEPDSLALHAQEIPPEALERREGEASAAERIERALGESSAPLRMDELRKVCRMRMGTVCETLADLLAEGRVVKSSQGYQIAAS